MPVYGPEITWVIITAHNRLHYQPSKPTICGHTMLPDYTIQPWFDGINWQTKVAPPLPSDVNFENLSGEEHSIPHIHLMVIRDNVKRLRDLYVRLNLNGKEIPAAIKIVPIVPSKIVFDRMQELNNLLVAAWLNKLNPLYDPANRKTGEQLLPSSYRASRAVLGEILDLCIELQDLHTNQGVHILPKIKGKKIKQKEAANGTAAANEEAKKEAYKAQFRPTQAEFLMAKWIYVLTVRKQKPNLGLREDELISKEMFGKNFKVNKPDNVVKLNLK